MDLEQLGQSLDCGQCFRWRRLPGGAWDGAAGGKHLLLTESGLRKDLEDGYWGRYFDMATDYAPIRAELAAKDPVLAAAVRYAPGIRILRQEPWEALCSFILSQCNNIARIRGMVERLCTAYGSAIPGAGGRCSFPGPEALASARETDLRALGLGFRAPYVLEASRRVASGSLDLGALERLPADEARARLTSLPGVGPKVADCALLYGMHRLEVFPRDVWMNRALKTLFPGRNPEWFGPHAGVAQQVLFHYSRHHPELFRAKAM